jgi:hypothetical protein
VVDDETQAQRIADAITAQGYVCVPRVPTKAMLNAAWADVSDHQKSSFFELLPEASNIIAPKAQSSVRSSRWRIVAKEWLEHRLHLLTDFARADVSTPTATPCLLCVAAATEASAIVASPAGSECGGDSSWQPAIVTKRPKLVRKHIGTARALIGNGNPGRV